jgi:DNA-binding NarL/FixJ family response regulator
MSRITVLLADDHPIVRQGLRSLLATEPIIEIIGEAADGREAVKQAIACRPDVVIMDIAMPLLNGADATRQIKQHLPCTKVLILSVYSDEEYIFQVFKAGASGYLMKDAELSDLVTAIHLVQRGDSYLSPSISRVVLDEYVRRAEKKGAATDLLTDREREVLRLISEGQSNKQIAALLDLSVRTVEHHRRNIMQKLDLHDTASLTRYAMRRGLIQ